MSHNIPPVSKTPLKCFPQLQMRRTDYATWTAYVFFNSNSIAKSPISASSFQLCYFYVLLRTLKSVSALWVFLFMLPTLHRFETMVEREIRQVGYIRSPVWEMRVGCKSPHHHWQLTSEDVFCPEQASFYRTAASHVVK